MKPKSNPFVVVSLAVFAAFSHTASAEDILKGDDTNVLNLGTSWALGAAPTSAQVATWSGTYNTAGSLSAAFTASTPVSWEGIKIGTITGTAAGLVSIGGTGAAVTGSQITIGTSGIDMSAANQNLVISAATTVLTGATQTWDVDAGRNLRLGASGTGAANANLDGAAGTVITVQGGGVVDANQGGGTGYSDAAGFAGFNGKWIVGAGTTLRGIRNGSTAWGSNTAADAITLSGGTLAVGGISGTQGSWTWNTKMTLADGTASNIDNQIFSGTNRWLKLEGAISGATLDTGSLTFKNTNSGQMNNDEYGFILTGANTFTGGMTINSGTYVRIGGSNAGTADSNAGNNGSLASALAITNSGVLRLTRNDTWTLGNTISGAGQLKIGGTVGTTTGQIVTLSGASTYTGATSIVNGTAKAGIASVAGVSGAFGNNSAVSLTNVASAALSLGGFDTQIGSLTGGGAAGGNILLGPNKLTIGGDNTSPPAYAGAISGSGGSLAKTGGGTLTLTGTNTYTGVTTLAAGTLSVASIGDGGFATGNLGAATNAAANLVFDGGTLQYTGLSASTNRNFIINAGKTATFDITANNLTVTGAVAATTGGLAKTGAGTLTLAAANSYTGVTTVSAGTLALTVNSALGRGLANISGQTSAMVDFGANTLTLGHATAGNSGDFFYGKLVGTGTLQLRGGSQTIHNSDGTGSTSGNFQIFQPVTAAMPTGAFALDTGLSVTDRKDFGFANDTNNVLTLSSLTGYGAIRTDVGGTAGSTVTRYITVDQSSGDTVFNGALLSHKSGANAVRALTFEKTGSSTLELAGFIGKETASANTGAAAVNLIVNGGVLNVTNAANTTTSNTDAINLGTVTVSSGTLAFSNQALLNTAGGAGAASIGMNGGTLRWNTGNTQDITAGNRLTLVAGKTATFDTNGNSVAFANALGGGAINASLVKDGAGTLTLNGTHNYTGSTTVSDGTLAVNGSISTGSVTVETGATLKGVGTIGGATTIQLGGTLSAGNSPGLLTVNNTLTLEGATLMEIGGQVIESEYDSVDVAGLLTFGGILDIVSYDLGAGLYNLAQAATYNLFGISGGTAGNFTAVTVGGIPLAGMDGVWTAVDPGDSAITYTFTQASGQLVVVPEPAAALLGGIGMLILLRRRRSG